MRFFLICMAFIAVQMPTLQDKPVVHLHPHQDNIPVDFGGELLVLANGPTVVHLPSLPPMMDSERRPWSVDVENLGPGVVTVVGKAQFSVQIKVDHTVRIKSNGVGYSSVP
jgi:hypothetical protein